jgi:serine/threonine protein kinase
MQVSSRIVTQTVRLRMFESDGSIRKLTVCVTLRTAMIGTTLEITKFSKKSALADRAPLQSDRWKTWPHRSRESLPPELTAREANLRRFEREARLASSLDHPNICTIFDLDEVDGVHFIAMQYVEGSQRAATGERPSVGTEEHAADRDPGRGRARSCAHARDIIHRDIKSGNVMVTPSGQVKILDFGLAKLLDDTDDSSRSTIHRTDLTEVGVPYGTATYAAPEQARGDRVDKRADIFSTGVLLYEMLTGTWPFRGKTTIDVRHAVLHDAPDSGYELRKEPIPTSAADSGSLSRERTARSLSENGRAAGRSATVLRENWRRARPPFTSVLPEPARHLSGASPVSRADALAERAERKIGVDVRAQGRHLPSRPFTKRRSPPSPIPPRRVWRFSPSAI